MANRHLSRSIVLQTLFEWDFRGADTKKATKDALEDTLLKNAHEFASGMENYTYIKSLLSGVLEKCEKLNEVIESAAPDWPLDKIATVDRNILRIGLYELLYADRGEVPPKVAINEAIELAKGFGGDSSGAFVNGVLGSIYREIGEPGKDQTSSNKIKDIPYEEMPIEELGGAVVYTKKDGEYLLALVHDVFGHWTLSKGHIDGADSTEEGIVSKINEETGLEIELEDKLGDNEYIAADPEKGKLRKQVTYYLAHAEYGEIEIPEDKGGLDDGAWFPLTEILDLNFYDDILPIVTKAVNILLDDENDGEDE